MTNEELSKILRQHAEAEHDRMRWHPSLKWTWGVDLDRQDIQQLFHAADTNYKIPHSAYDYSLKTGNFEGSDSCGPTMPRLKGWVPSLISDTGVIAELQSDNVP